MALDFIDSCAHSGIGLAAIPISRKWTGYFSATYVNTPTRASGVAIALNGGFITRTLAYKAERFMGAAYYLPTGSNSALRLMGMQSGGLDMASVRIETDHTVSIITATTHLWNSAPLVITLDAYHYIEFHVVLSGATPIIVTCDLTIDGKNWKTGASGSTTINSSSLLCTPSVLMNQIFFSGGDSGSFTAYVCDVYACNADGTDINGHATTLNTFLGDVSIGVVVPVSDVTTQWSIGAGGGTTHFNLVNEIPPDDDTTYIKSSTVGQNDNYLFNPIAGFSGNLLGVQMLLYAKKDAEGSRAIRGTVGGTAQVNNNGTDQYLYDYYDYFIFPLDSDNGVSWTPTIFNAEHFGVDLSV